VLPTAQPFGMSAAARLSLVQRVRHLRHARHIVTFRSGGNHASIRDGAASPGVRPKGGAVALS
jgi:hypothetical protein